MSKALRSIVVLLIFFILLFSLVSVGALVNARSDTAAAQLAQPAQNGADASQILTGGVGYIMTGAYAFHPYYFTDARAFSSAYLYNPNENATTFQAPLTLPHGASLTKMVLFFRDQSSANFTVHLNRCALGSGTCYTLAEIVTSGSETGYRSLSDTTISSSTVDDLGNTYHLTASIPGSEGSGLLLCGVRIDYEYDTSYLPVILN